MYRTQHHPYSGNLHKYTWWGTRVFSKVSEHSYCHLMCHVTMTDYWFEKYDIINVYLGRNIITETDLLT